MIMTILKRLNPFLILLVLLGITFSCSKDENKSPQVTIGVIQNNMEIVKGIPISFTVEASDDDGEVVSVLVVIDGENYDTAVTAPYLFSWETVDKTAGEHSISAQATDNEGATSIHAIKVKVITDVDPILPCQGGITISYEGQTYNTLQVGGQCWLRENMNVTTANSAPYNNDPGNSATYGQLYTWEEAMTACPPGWHLPSYEEWCDLVKHVDATAYCDEETANGTDAGFKLKSAGGWANDHHGSDQFGFKARPGGYKGADGAFNGLGHTAAFWSSSESGSQAFAWSMSEKTTQAQNSKHAKTEMRSVRCIRD